MSDKVPQYIKRLHYQHVKSSEIQNPIIGFDLHLIGEINASIIKDAFYSTVREFYLLNVIFQIDTEGLRISQCRYREDLFSFIECLDPDIAELQRKTCHSNIDPMKGRNILGTLFQLDVDDYVFCITASHLVTDAKSMEIFAQRFLENLKKGYSSGVESVDSLPGLPMKPIVEASNTYEISRMLGGDIFKRIREFCFDNNLTLFSFLMSVLSKIPKLGTDIVGVLFSNRTQDTLNDVGCFVQAAPIYLHERKSVIKMAESIRLQTVRTQKAIRNGNIQEPPNFRVMLSMVRDSDTSLVGPEGVQVEYIRRPHSRPECPLHIYLYLSHDQVEVVFSYDPVFWKPEMIHKLIDTYTDAVQAAVNDISTSEQPEERSFSPRFEHIGIAVWEMDIGLRRLSNLSCRDNVELRVTDSSMHVELASFKQGIPNSLELVAPLSSVAPCVNFLEQYGEGPYHICWRVESFTSVLKALEQSFINFTVLNEYEGSALFPETKILFLHIVGIGLIEILEKGNKSKRNTDPFSFEIISNDFENAVKFIHLFEFKPDNPAKSIWVNPEKTIRLKLKLDKGIKDSFITGIFSEDCEAYSLPSEVRSLSEDWKKRVCL